MLPGEDRLEALRELVSDDPDDAFSRYALAMQLRSLGRADEALRELATLLERQPDYVATYYQYGSLLRAAGEEERAREVIGLGLEAARKAGNRRAEEELGDLLEELE